MYRKILVPLDGSVLAEGVLPYVRSIARAIQVPVELLQVNDRARARAYVPAVQVAQYLEKIAASFSGITDVKSTLELGNPADAIVDHAAGQPDALIAMATHGYSGGQRWLLGSVAEKVLHGATNHLLLVRPAGGHRRQSPLEHDPGTAGRFGVGRKGAADGNRIGFFFEG